jgi:hypothetical protein
MWNGSDQSRGDARMTYIEHHAFGSLSVGSARAKHQCDFNSAACGVAKQKSSHFGRSHVAALAKPQAAEKEFYTTY